MVLRVFQARLSLFLLTTVPGTYPRALRRRKHALSFEVVATSQIRGSHGGQVQVALPETRQVRARLGSVLVVLVAVRTLWAARKHNHEQHAQNSHKIVTHEIFTH